MRKIMLLSFLAVGTASLAGCGNQSQPTSAGDQPAAAPAPTEQPAGPADASANDSVVDVAVNSASNEAVPVIAGQKLTGAFVAPQTGSVESLSVVIGNNLNTSDGKLSTKLCQGGVCVEGSADLSSSVDNTYFKIPLAQPLTVTVDAPIEYTLSKDGGSVPVAVYLFAAQEGSGATTSDLTTGAATPRLPQFGLGYIQ